MSLSFLSKKSWHTATLQNAEKTWVAEQQKAEEEKKLRELQQQIAEERELEELNALHPGKAKRTKLEWMYQGPKAQTPTAEEYLKGKAFEGLEDKNDVVKLEEQKSEAPGSLWLKQATSNSNENFAKIHGDPLLAIKRKQLEARQKVLQNPITMAQVRQRALAKAMSLKKETSESHSEKEEKRSKKSKKSRRKKHRRGRSRARKGRSRESEVNRSSRHRSRSADGAAPRNRKVERRGQRKGRAERRSASPDNHRARSRYGDTSRTQQTVTSRERSRSGNRTKYESAKRTKYESAKRTNYDGTRARFGSTSRAKRPRSRSSSRDKRNKFRSTKNAKHRSQSPRRKTRRRQIRRSESRTNKSDTKHSERPADSVLNKEEGKAESIPPADSLKAAKFPHGYGLQNGPKPIRSSNQNLGPSQDILDARAEYIREKEKQDGISKPNSFARRNTTRLSDEDKVRRLAKMKADAAWTEMHRKQELEKASNETPQQENGVAPSFIGDLRSQAGDRDIEEAIRIAAGRR